MSTEVIAQDEAAFQGAISDVRSDVSETNWALFSHYNNDPNCIHCIGTGTGGVEEMAENMDDAYFMYALVRLEETFDMSMTIKFAYIQWQGKSVPFIKRGKFGVVHGSIEKLFDPYHACIEVDSLEDLTSEFVRTKIQETSGTKSRVLETEDAKQRPERGFTSGTTTKMDSTGTTPTRSAKLTNIGKLGSSFGGVSAAAKSSTGIPISQQVTDAVQDVRSDGSETSWLACSYENGDVKKPLVLLGVGDGTQPVEQFKALCTETNVVYGFIRVSDTVDDIATVKFVYIRYVGESIKPMTRAKIGTHKGDLEKLFYPTHVSIFATAISDLGSRIVMDKVMSASGSKSHVK